jgi:hypothetical protein
MGIGLKWPRMQSIHLYLLPPLRFVPLQLHSLAGLHDVVLTHWVKFTFYFILLISSFTNSVLNFNLTKMAQMKTSR